MIVSSSGESSTIWINQQRFGDVGGQKLGGFVGGMWVSNGDDALAWGWGGGWRRWHSSVDLSSEAEVWNEAIAISGHSGPVRGLSWSSGGEYLITAGSVHNLTGELIADGVLALIRQLVFTPTQKQILSAREKLGMK